jgi:hypothetical protein
VATSGAKWEGNWTAAVEKGGEIGEEGRREGGIGEKEEGKETRHKLKSMVALVRCKKSAPRMGCETLACRKECVKS